MPVRRGSPGQLDAGAGTGAEEAGAGDVPDGVGAGPDVVAGAEVLLGDGLADREGLAVLAGLGDDDEAGADDGVVAGPGYAGVGCPAGWTVPADTGRTQMYSASTPRNAAMSTMVEVRGRPIMTRSPSPGRYRVRRPR
jgi:hypothetical protein